MKKKVLSAVLASMMGIMLMGTQVLAAGGELSTRGDAGNTITGESDVKDPIYCVVVPTTLEFSVDAFEQGQRSQIYSADFPIINKSNVNVKVDVALKVEGASGQNVTFVSKADDVTTDGSSTAREVYIAASVPAAVTVTAGTAVDQMVGTDKIFNVTTTAETTGINVAAADDTAALALAEAIDGTAYASGTAGLGAAEVKITPDVVAGTFTYSGTKDFVEVPLSTTDSTLTFALEKATYATEYYSDATTKANAFSAMAASDTGVATYRFYGVVNDNADWQLKDLKATAAYSFIGLSDANYTALAAKTVEIGASTAHGLVKAVEPTKAVLNYSTQTFWGALTSNGGITDSSKLSNVALTRANGSPVTVPSADYTVGSNGWIQITWAKASSLLSCTWAEDITFTLTYTYDGVEYTSNVIPK